MLNISPEFLRTQDITSTVHNRRIREMTTSTQAVAEEATTSAVPTSLLARIIAVDLSTKNPLIGSPVQLGDKVIGELDEWMVRLFHLMREEKARTGELERRANEIAQQHVMEHLSAGDDAPNHDCDAIAKMVDDAQVEAIRSQYLKDLFWTMVRFDHPEVNNQNIAICDGYKVVLIGEEIEPASAESVIEKFFSAMGKRFSGARIRIVRS